MENRYFRPRNQALISSAHAVTPNSKSKIKCELDVLKTHRSVSTYHLGYLLD